MATKPVIGVLLGDAARRRSGACGKMCSRKFL